MLRLMTRHFKSFDIYYKSELVKEIYLKVEDMSLNFQENN